MLYSRLFSSKRGRRIWHDADQQPVVRGAADVSSRVVITRITRTIALTSSSLSIFSSAAMSPERTCCDNAFTGGLSTVITAIGPRRAVLTSVIEFSSSRFWSSMLDAGIVQSFTIAHRCSAVVTASISALGSAAMTMIAHRRCTSSLSVRSLCSA